jgi:TRAP transporter TAXI family solute receptor
VAGQAPRNRGLYSIWFSILLTSVVGLVATYLLFVEAPPPRKIVMAAGGKEGAYYHFAERYQDLLKKDGIELEILTSKGSVENLGMLQDNDSKVSIAFVQTGIVDPENSHSLFALASLYREPLWIFYRSSDVIDRLTQLQGMRIAIGPEGSGTRVIAEQLLTANGLTVESTDSVSLSGNAAATALEMGEIEVAFFVAGIDATYIPRLLKNPEIRLVELAQAEAYERRFRFLSAVTIHEGLIDLKQDIPSKDVLLISPAATLVAHKSLHPALVSLFLKAASKVHHHGDLLSNVGEFPSPLLTDLPVSEDAERFFRSGPPVLQRFLPFWLASLVDRLKIMIIPLIMLLMPLIRMAPPLVRWQTRRKIYLWYAELRQVDQLAIHGMSNDQTQQSLEKLQRLEQQIAGVGVPLSYMQEYYNLRLHLNLVRSRVNSVLHPAERTESAMS